MKYIKFFNIKFVIIFALIATFLVGIAMSGFFNRQSPTAKKTEIEAHTIMESINAIAELTTLSYNYKDVGTFSEQYTMNIFGTDFGILGTMKSFIIVYEGEMKIGLDFSQIRLEIEENKILIIMPDVKILSHVISEDSVEILNEKNGLFNHISVEDYPNFIAEQKLMIEDKAKDSGLLLQALENAKTQIIALLSAMPGIADEYVIIFG